MVLLEKLWDDVLAGPQPERGLGRLRKLANQSFNLRDEGEGSKFQKSLSMPASPSTPGTPTMTSPTGARKDNVWRSVFNPGSNLATKGIGAEMYDKPNPNSPPFMTGSTARRLGASITVDERQVNLPSRCV
ncbi:hypothetical protein NMG60_11012747 [Bertholletia excelsa]